MDEGFESEDYRAWNKMKQEKRAKNREDSARMLRESGFDFTEHNGGAHLVVSAGKATFDFWPGTGSFIRRGETKKRRGVRSLIGALRMFKMTAPSNSFSG